MSSFHSTHLLHLPPSIKEDAARCAEADGLSFDQFVATAVAEKIAALDKAAYFAERCARVDLGAFDQLMSRLAARSLPSGSKAP